MFAYGTIVPVVKPTKPKTQCNLCGAEKGTGKMYLCRGCGVHAYCCRAHQRRDWASHKAMCEEMQAIGAGKKILKSQSLVKTFGISIRTYINRVFTAADFSGTGKVYRATRRGDVFYTHQLSMKEFFLCATGLMPDAARRKAFLNQAFEGMKEGQLVFVIFSSQTKAHAIVSVSRL